jgi:hypothetical protein
MATQDRLTLTEHWKIYYPDGIGYTNDVKSAKLVVEKAVPNSIVQGYWKVLPSYSSEEWCKTQDSGSLETGPGLWMILGGESSTLL